MVIRGSTCPISIITFLLNLYRNKTESSHFHYHKLYIYICMYISINRLSICQSIFPLFHTHTHSSTIFCVYIFLFGSNLSVINVEDLWRNLFSALRQNPWFLCGSSSGIFNFPRRTWRRKRGWYFSAWNFSILSVFFHCGSWSGKARIQGV